MSDVTDIKKKRLFRDVDARLLTRSLAALKALRQLYPNYRDDELLLRLLCDAEGRQGA